MFLADTLSMVQAEYSVHCTMYTCTVYFTSSYTITLLVRDGELADTDTFEASMFEADTQSKLKGVRTVYNEYLYCILYQVPNYRPFSLVGGELADTDMFVSDTLSKLKGVRAVYNEHLYCILYLFVHNNLAR